MKLRTRRTRRNIVQSRFVTGATAGSIIALIRAVRATSQTIYEPSNFYDVLRGNVPFIFAMWHGQFMMLAVINTREYPVSAMVARHGDGEIIARVLKSFDIQAIRGAGAGERRTDRGGAYALRAATRALNAGTILAMTADVPPSKPRHCGMGIITLARLTGRPVIAMAAATSRNIKFNTWSRMTINLPFSKLALVAGEPITVPADADELQLEQKRLEVERSLNVVTDRAYEIVHSSAKRGGTQRKSST